MSDKYYNVIYCFDSVNLLLNKLTEINVPYVYLKDKYRILSKYIFIPCKRSACNIHKINVSSYGYFLTKVGMEEFAKVNLNETNSLLIGKNKDDYVGKVIKINKGIFKHQYGKCEKIRKEKALISMYLFSGRKTKVSVPLDHVEPVRVNGR